LFTNFKFWVKYYLNIDSLGKGIASKIIFLMMVMIRVIPNFLPSEYTDFSKVQDWMTTVLYAEEITEDMMIIPLSRANYLFLLIASAVLFICGMIAVFYCGLAVRHFRNLENKPNLKLSSFWGRFIILCIVMLIIAMPFAFTAVYLFLLFLLALPFMVTIIPCYLSGDEGLWRSFTGIIKRTKGRYLLILRDLTGVYLVYLIISFLINAVSLVSMTAFAVLNCACDSWFLLVAARFCAIQYTMTKKI